MIARVNIRASLFTSKKGYRVVRDWWVLCYSAWTSTWEGILQLICILVTNEAGSERCSAQEDEGGFTEVPVELGFGGACFGSLKVWPYKGRVKLLIWKAIDVEVGPLYTSVEFRQINGTGTKNIWQSYPFNTVLSRNGAMLEVIEICSLLRRPSWRHFLVVRNI